MFKIDKDRIFRKFKRKLRFTLGKKASLAVILMAIAFTVFSIMAIRVLFLVVTVNEQIVDLYAVGDTAFGVVGNANSEKACDYVRRVYEGIPEEERKNPADPDYLDNFSKKDFEKNEIDELKISHVFKVIKEKNPNVTDVGLCLFDDNKSRIIQVQDLGDKRIGFWEDFDESPPVPFSAKGASMIYSSRIGKSDDGFTDLTLKVLIPVSSNYKGELQGCMYIDCYNEEIGRYQYVFTILYMLFFAFIALLVMFVINSYINRKIIRPIKKLSDAADDWSAAGDIIEDKYYFRHLRIKSNDEVKDLKDAMEGMESKLHEYIKDFEAVTKEKMRMSTELEITAKLQANMLPDKLENPENDFGLFPFMRPARLVGGDFYDFFMIDAHKVGLVIADVSDKGVPASLFMVVSRTILKNEMKENPANLEQSVKKANRRLCENNKDMMFVTAFVGIYDSESRTLSYINAGHEDLIVYEREADRYRIQDEEHDVMLGVFEDAQFNHKELMLKAGDRLFMYTDGITEAMDNHENLFGMDRLLNSLNEDTSLEGDGIIGKLWDDISQFQNGCNQADDVTMLLLEV